MCRRMHEWRPSRRTSSVGEDLERRVELDDVLCGVDVVELAKHGVVAQLPVGGELLVCVGEERAKG